MLSLMAQESVLRDAQNIMYKSYQVTSQHPSEGTSDDTNIRILPLQRAFHSLCLIEWMVNEYALCFNFQKKIQKSVK